MNDGGVFQIPDLKNKYKRAEPCAASGAAGGGRALVLKGFFGGLAAAGFGMDQ